jgi:hypothetical protein
MKMFGGTFDKMESFRYELKKGAPDSIFAIFGFALIALLSTIATVVLSAGFIEDVQIVRNIGIYTLLTFAGIFMYNVIKAAWECFVYERNELIETLRNS